MKTQLFWNPCNKIYKFHYMHFLIRAIVFVLKFMQFIFHLIRSQVPCTAWPPFLGSNLYASRVVLCKNFMASPHSYLKF